LVRYPTQALLAPLTFVSVTFRWGAFATNNKLPFESFRKLYLAVGRSLLPGRTPTMINQMVIQEWKLRGKGPAGFLAQSEFYDQLFDMADLVSTVICRRLA
jgi:hypothetical protein